MNVEINDAAILSAARGQINTAVQKMVSQAVRDYDIRGQVSRTLNERVPRTTRQNIDKIIAEGSLLTAMAKRSVTENKDAISQLILTEEFRKAVIERTAEKLAAEILKKL